MVYSVLSPPSSSPQSCGLYLGVWARVKRRLCRLMLRFISSFLKSSGEFRGDPRGESLGELFGDPPGEPAFDLGMSWMTGSLVSICSCSLSSTSGWSSSELSVHRSLMVEQRVVRNQVSSFTPLLKFGPKYLSQNSAVSRADFTWCFCDGICQWSIFVCQIQVKLSSSGPVLTSSHLDKTWTCCPLQNSCQHSQRSCFKKQNPTRETKPLQSVNKMTPLTEFYLYLKPNESLSCLFLGPCCLSCWAIDSNISVEVLSHSLPLPGFVYITARPSLSPTKYGCLIYREETHDRLPPSAFLSLFPIL